MTTETNNNKGFLKPIAHEKVESSIRTIRSLFILGAVASILFSWLHFSNLINKGYSMLDLYNVVSNFIVAVIYFLCVYLLNKRRAVLVYVYGGMTVYTIIASIFFGSWINVLTIAIELVFIVTFYILKQQGELH